MRTLPVLVLAVLFVGTGLAAPIPGTVVAAKITTGDSANTFSIGDTAEMAGTSKQVADLATRDAIVAERRTEGMTCWVIDQQKQYRLVGGTNNAAWVEDNFASPVFNDGVYLHLTGTVTNQNAPWYLGNNGEVLVGTNVLAAGLAPGFHSFASASFTDSNQPAVLFFDLVNANNVGREHYAIVAGSVAEGDNSSATWTVATFDSTHDTNNLTFRASAGNNAIAWNVGGTNRAWLSYDGTWHGRFDGEDLTITNGITNLSLTPITLLSVDANKRLQSVANGAGYLYNDGSGGLVWQDVLTLVSNYWYIQSNVVVKGNLFLTNYFLTNGAYRFLSTWVGPTNSFSVNTNMQVYETYVPCAVTQFIGGVSGFAADAQLSISNASSSNITLTVTAANSRSGDYTNVYVITNSDVLDLGIQNINGSWTKYLNRGFH